MKRKKCAREMCPTSATAKPWTISVLQVLCGTFFCLTVAQMTTSTETPPTPLRTKMTTSTSRNFAPASSSSSSSSFQQRTPNNKFAQSADYYAVEELVSSSDNTMLLQTVANSDPTSTTTTSSSTVVITEKTEESTSFYYTDDSSSIATFSSSLEPIMDGRLAATAAQHRTVERSIDDFDYETSVDPSRSTPAAAGSRGASALPPMMRQRSAEHLLHSMLFAPGRYQKNVRPVNDHGQSIKVRLGVCIMTIDEIIEKDQTMITSGCVKMKWNDEFLRWNPEEYKNLSWMALPSTDIWIPDIALINSPDPYYITRKPAFSEVAFTGDVGYYPSGRWSTRCQISLTYFPFDFQKCDLRFESWVYPVQWLYMEPWHPEPVDMKDYYRNHQWDLERFSVTPGNITYDGLEFSTIRFSFYFKRRTLYYTVLSIFPCLIMSVLQMFSHTLPVEHPARMTLLTSLFVSSSVIQSSLASQMPKSSDGVSLIQLYLMIFSTNLLISMLITFMNMHVWFRVPMSAIPTCHRMLRAFFLDTGRPQHPQATATSAIAAISAAAMPLMSMPGGGLAAPTMPPPSRPAHSSFLKKIGQKLADSRARARQQSEQRRQQAQHNTDEDELAMVAMVEANQRQQVVMHDVVDDYCGGGGAALQQQDNEMPSQEDKSVVSATAGADSSSNEDCGVYYPDEAARAKGQQQRRKSHAAKQPPKASLNKPAPQPQQHDNWESAACCCFGLRRRGTGHRYQHHHHQQQQQQQQQKRLSAHRPSLAAKKTPHTPPPPPPPPPGAAAAASSSSAAAGAGARRGALVPSSLNAPPSAANLAERKDRWLQFSMLIDKVFLYAMFIYNLLCPVVIFGLVPEIQRLYAFDENENEDTMTFDPAQYMKNA